jgi:hypothetical protein
MVIAVVLFFSLAHSVEAYYVLPALPSLAIMISGVFAIRSELGGAKQTIAARFRDASLAGISATMLALILFSWWYCAGGRSLHVLQLRPASEDWLLAHLYYQGVAHLQRQFLLLIISTGVGAVLSIGGLISRNNICTASGVVVAAIAAVSFWTGTMRTELYETLTIKPFACAVRQRVGDTPVYTITQNYEVTFYYGDALPLYRHSPVSDMFGRADLPTNLLKRAGEDASTAYIILREHDQLYLSQEERNGLRPVLAARPGVFRNPRLFLIDRGHLRKRNIKHAKEPERRSESGQSLHAPLYL